MLYQRSGRYLCSTTEIYHSVDIGCRENGVRHGTGVGERLSD